jgi:two-component system sensor histidine kinase BaeS
MTKRLTTTILLVVLVTLALVGTGTVILANAVARQNTERDLVNDVQRISANLAVDLAPEEGASERESQQALLRRLRSYRRVRGVLQVDGIALSFRSADGRLLGDQPPAWLPPERLDPLALADGSVISGNVGNRVYAAQQTTLPRGQLVLTVLAREANAGLTPSIRLFLLAALATIGFGSVVAWLLGRRLARPVTAAAQAAQSIAGGNLDVRLAHGNRDDELDQLAAAVNDMAAALQRNRAAEQQFLLSVSHDLRTPLTSIRGYAEAMIDGAAGPGAAATVIRERAEHLDRLVADLLDLAKLRARSFVLHPERVVLQAAIDTAVTSLSPAANERHVSCTHDGPPTPVVVHADPDRLAQVITNLVANAVRFAATTVEVRVDRQADGWALITVDDDGPGIADDDLGRVFERLYVGGSPTERREASSGLGLAIVAELTAAMGGTVRAERSPTLGGARLCAVFPPAP